MKLPIALCAAALLAALPLRAQTPSTSEEEVVTLDPFCVTSEDDSGYRANGALAGTRFRGEVKDVGSAISVVTAQFLRDTASAMPQVPVTIVKKADALVMQFALACTADKAEVRNAEVSRTIEQLTKALADTRGLRLEPREIFLASADRRKSLIGKGGIVTSFAHFVVFAELGEGTRPFQRVKQVKELFAGLKIDTPTTKLVDGPIGLYIRRPGQFRGELLGKVFEDMEVVRKGVGPDFEVRMSGLNGAVRLRACSESEIELWIDYSFEIRSIRELEAKQKKKD